MKINVFSFGLPKTSKMTARAPKTITNSWKIEGPLDLISDVLLSIFDFERQYNDFHGFSSSGGSLEDNKSTKIDSDNHIETMYRQNTVQGTICIKKSCLQPSKIASQIT